MDTESEPTGERRINNLVAIVGRWKFEERRIVFEAPENLNLPFGICVSNIRFSEGEAQVTVQRTDAAMEGRIVLGWSPQNEYVSVGIGAGGYRCLFYQNSIGGKRRVKEGLRKHLQAILDE
jgi:hypothetical protein